MDLSKALQELKKEPGFTENVGMVLIHNGVVRGWSRKKKGPVASVRVRPDHSKINEIVQEFEQKRGIFKILVHAFSGELGPGDDLLYILVAGDIRENVKPVLADILDRIKAEAVTKEEVFTKT